MKIIKYRRISTEKKRLASLFRRAERGEGGAKKAPSSSLLLSRL